MGLSRKLGGGGASSSRDPAPSDVDYTWSTQAYTMREILTRFQLPCVVQCAGDAGAVLWSHFRFDMRQPLLLHAARTVRKVHARSLKATGTQYGQLEEFGPPLAIPEDYDGWFFPVGRKDPTILPRHTRVESAADSPNRRFLVTTTLPALTPAKTAGGSGPSFLSPKHVQHEVSIGEVLTKVGVVKGDILRCVDENKHEVILPFNHRALLYDVDDNFGVSTTTTTTAGTPAATAAAAAAAPSSTAGVVHTRTIVNAGNKHLPRVFRHVLGELPALSHAFTGIVRCYTVFTEETVMAAPMSRANLNSSSKASFLSFSSSSSSPCLELATDSSAKFNIALNATELKRTRQYFLALKTCEEQAPSYVRAIKASFTVQPVFCGDSSGGGGGEDPFNLALYRGIEARQGHDEKQGEGSPRIEMLKEATQRKSSPASAASKTTPATADVMDFHTAKDRAQTAPAGDAERAVVGTPEFQDYVTRDDDESVLTTSDDNALDDEAESVLTDDVDADTASQSDATDFASEVEATSEFHFEWGQLKQARPYSESVSSLTESDTATPSTNTDTEDEDDLSALDHSGEGDDSQHSSLNTSFRSHSSAVTRGAGSSAGTSVTNSGTNSSKRTTSSNSSAPSVATVVLRASAPSPVYANVPKKGHGLSVFHAPGGGEENHRGGSADGARSDVLPAGRGRERTEQSAPSVDTVVSRASAPSPVYANVPKIDQGLSVFHVPESGVENHRGGSADGVRSGVVLPAEREEERKERPLTPDGPYHDNTVRSVWNVTPTMDDAGKLSRCRPVDDLPSVLAIEGDDGEDDEDAAPPLWWGDTDHDVTADADADPDPAILMDSDEAILQLHSNQRRPSGESGSERCPQAETSGDPRLPAAAPPPSVRLQKPLSARSSLSSQGGSATSHTALSAASSSSSAATDSSAATVILHGKPYPRSGRVRPSPSSTLSAPFLHAPLSATSSTHSEGSAQDLAIQRLEWALNEATNYLKSSGPVVPAPASVPVDAPASAYVGRVDPPPPASPDADRRPDLSGGSSARDLSSSSLLSRPLPPLPSDPQRRPSSSAEDRVSAQRRGRKAKVADISRRRDDDRGSFSSSDDSNTPRRSRRGSRHKVSDEDVTSVPLDRNCDDAGRRDVVPMALPRFTSTTFFAPSASKPRSAGTRNFGPARSRQVVISRFQSDSNIHTDPTAAQRPAAFRRQSAPALDNETANQDNHSHYRSDSALTDAQLASRDVSSQRGGGSNSQIYPPGRAEDGAEHGEGQIDLEFVKTLGDRLLAVSKKSTLPKYQRLYHESENLADGEKNQDGRYLFQKKKQRPGSSSFSHVTGPDEDEGDTAAGSSSRKLELDATLDDFDFLHEEAV